MFATFNNNNAAPVVIAAAPVAPFGQQHALNQPFLHANAPMMTPIMAAHQQPMIIGQQPPSIQQPIVVGGVPHFAPAFNAAAPAMVQKQAAKKTSSAKKKKAKQAGKIETSSTGESSNQSGQNNKCSPTASPTRMQLMINSIPQCCTEDEVRAIFSEFGDLERANLIRDHSKKNAVHRGFGFIGYKTKEAAARAVEKMNGFELYGSAIRVAFAEREI